MQIPIFVINLDRSPDRLAAIAERLSELSLAFERVPAIAGATLSERDARAAVSKRFWRHPPSRGEIGCYLSHIKALRAVLASGAEQAIILEDDAAFTDEFRQVCSGGINPGVPFDILKLEGANCNAPAIKPKGAAENVFYVVNSHGSAAYLITREGTKKVLERLPRLRYRYDDDLFCNWRNGLHIYDILPYSVRQRAHASTIQDRRAEPGYWLKLFRIVPKKIDKIRRDAFIYYRFGSAPP